MEACKHEVANRLLRLSRRYLDGFHVFAGPTYLKRHGFGLRSVFLIDASSGYGSFGGHPKPANEGHLKTGQ
jgi:hypothetical protein